MSFPLCSFYCIAKDNSPNVNRLITSHRNNTKSYLFQTKACSIDLKLYVLLRYVLNSSGYLLFHLSSVFHCLRRLLCFAAKINQNDLVGLLSIVLLQLPGLIIVTSGQQVKVSLTKIVTQTTPRTIKIQLTHSTS